MNDYKKVLVAIVISLSISTIGAAAKAYVDVEKLKTEISFVFDMLVEIKDDVSEIKAYLLDLKE